MVLVAAGWMEMRKVIGSDLGWQAKGRRKQIWENKNQQDLAHLFTQQICREHSLYAQHLWQRICVYNVGWHIYRPCSVELTVHMQAQWGRVRVPGCIKGSTRSGHVPQTRDQLVKGAIHWVLNSSLLKKNGPYQGVWNAIRERTISRNFVCYMCANLYSINMCNVLLTEGQVKIEKTNPVKPSWRMTTHL